MSEVNATDLRLIDSPDEVRHLYEGAGANARTGVEVELAFFNPSDPALAPMTVPQNHEVKNKANSLCGENCVRNEPSSDMLEVSSVALSPDNLKLVMKNIQGKIKFLTDTAASLGLKRSYFQEQPQATAKQLFKNLVDLERYQAFFGPPRADMMGVAAYFFVCKSNQISVSYRDPDHMLENVRRLYFLAPFLFLLTDNSSGFNETRPHAGHSGMYHRAALTDRGGVMPYVFTARTGADYIDAHINNVMNNKMFVYYDRDGKLVRVPTNEWQSFNKLRELHLNTASNYYLSQSILWPDVKIAALKDSAGEVNNHRYEARMFGVGIHQHQTALLITSGLAFNADFAAKTDRLLKDFGFGSDLDKAKILLEKSYDAARNHAGKFFDIAYGTGRMNEFARKFADLVESAYAGQGFDDELAPALAILRSGCTDAKINRLLFPTLEKTLEHQRTYDPAIFDHPNFSASMVFEREIKKHHASSSCAHI